MLNFLDRLVSPLAEDFSSGKKLAILTSLEHPPKNVEKVA